MKPETGWMTATETAKLAASDGASPSQFGFSVAIDDTTVVVGAWRDSRRGAAYVFVKPETGWATTTEVAKLTASDGETFDQFAISVAIRGGTVVVGDWNDDAERGSAYVFVKPETGWVTAIESSKLTASDGVSADHFGTSVDLNGDTVVAGASGDDSARGSAYVFGSVQPPAAPRSPLDRSRRSNPRASLR